jgi:hypothetical protein
MQPLELSGLNAYFEYTGRQLENLTSLVLVIPRDIELRNEPTAIAETFQYIQALQQERTDMHVSFVTTGKSENHNETSPSTEQTFALDGILSEIGSRKWNVRRAKNAHYGTWEIDSGTHAS